MSDSEENSLQDLSLQDRSLSLTESADAVKAVLKGCRAELDKLQRRLRGTLPKESPLREDDGRRNTPQNHALYLAMRLEACAETLRRAADSSDG